MRTSALAVGLGALALLAALVVGADAGAELKPGDAAHVERLDPAVRGEFAALMVEAYRVAPFARIVSSRRTVAEQVRLYAQGRTAPGPIVTQVSGDRSWHVRGRAVDLAGLSVPELRELARWWRARGGKWGGDFPGLFDPGHFEFHPGLTLDDPWREAVA